MPKTSKSPSPKARKSPTTKKHPTQEEIALRAYHIFLERGGAPGNEQADWIRAERELLEQSGKPRGRGKLISIAA
jgi:hypothetical protein